MGESGKSDAALELLNLLVTEHAEPSQLTLAYERKGSALRASGNLHAAIEAFAAGEQAERAFPMMHTRCSLLLAMLIVEERMVERYAEARTAVELYVSRNPELPFPIDAYRVNVVRAALAKKDRRDAQAKHHAEAALAAGEAKASAFTRHPKLGLVGSATSRLHSWLRRWST